MNRLGWFSEWMEGLGQLTLLAREIVVSLFTKRLSWRQVLYQIYFIGIKSQSVVLITGAFTGMVMAAQTYFQFHKVRMDTATMAVVSVSMCSELGPVLTGLMVAGRVGAALRQSWAPCASPSRSMRCARWPLIRWTTWWCRESWRHFSRCRC